MSDTILIIDESRDFRESIRKPLENSGYRIIASTREHAADGLLEDTTPALILLQWTDAAATEALIGLLKSAPESRASRIIIVAAKHQIGEAIDALEYGADDCISTPFASAELVGRVTACFRRPLTVTRRDRVRAGPLVLDRVARRLLVRDDSLVLAPTEFRLMEFFIEHPGRAFSRQELLQHAWPKNVSAGRRTVDVNVRRLRKVLEPFSCDQMIQTVRGYGYRFSVDDRSVGARTVSTAAAYSRVS